MGIQYSDLSSLQQMRQALMKKEIFDELEKEFNRKFAYINEKLVAPVGLALVKKYALDEVVKTPWKDRDGNYRRVPIFVGHKTVVDEETKQIKTVPNFKGFRVLKYSIQRNSHKLFADGFVIDMDKTTGMCQIVSEFPTPPSFYPNAVNNNEQSKDWYEKTFAEHILLGDIFAPPDLNPHGDFQWLSKEEYEDYRDESNLRENRYPLRDYQGHAHKEFQSKSVQMKICILIIKYLLSQINIDKIERDVYERI